MRLKLDFVHSGMDALMRNFNSRDGIFKPIPGIKITPEGIPIQNEGHKNVQSRVKMKIVKKAQRALEKMKKIDVKAENLNFPIFKK